ncbi:MAG: hypothetical protein NC177_11880 [Ruminococcus flavefaciens]|nr:hypothetical protein [Ruminococcus flavefaciens]
MNTKALLVATATLLALSAVSCGKDDTEDSSVSISLSEEQTATKETSEEATTQTETTTTETSTDTTTTSAVSGTETTTVTTVSDSATTTDTAISATTATAETSQTEETTQSEQQEQPTENNTPTEETPQETQQPETTSPAEDSPQPEPTEVKFSIDNLLSDASGIISALGTPEYSGQGAACTNNGNEVKIYQYSGLEIQCYIDGDKEYIFQITITNDKYQTSNGITTGNTRADVESAYGTGEESGSYTIYYSGDKEMDIQYSDDTVVSILFYTQV